MQNVIRGFIFLAVALFTTAALAQTCPVALQNVKSQYLPDGVKSLCELSVRYWTATNKLAAKGVHASYIADLRAPRFIKLGKWDNDKKNKNYSPWYIYDPSPLTWSNWEKTAAYVDQEARTNLANGYIPEIAQAWLLKVQEMASKDLIWGAGELRSTQNYGRAFWPEWAPTLQQVENLKKFEIPQIFEKEKSLLTWRATQCIDQLTPQCKTEMDGRGMNPDCFQDIIDNRKGKQCGYVVYPPVIEVWSQMEAIMKETNLHAREWQTGRGQDPLYVLARLQRWLVAVHPFNAGNGRTSRFFMEYLAQSIGLPTVILRDMDEDYMSDVNTWAREIGAGMLRTVEIVEKCADDPKKRSCTSAGTTAW